MNQITASLLKFFLLIFINLLINSASMGNLASTSSIASMGSHITDPKNQCFIAMQANKIIKKIGGCHIRHTPYGTTSLLMQLAGYQQLVAYPKAYTANTKPQSIDKIKPQNIDKINDKLFNAIKNLYIFAKNTDLQRIKIAAKISKYGLDICESTNSSNNFSGKTIINNNNSLQYWLLNCLKVSPMDQINFINKLINNKLPFSQEAHDLTRNALLINGFQQTNSIKFRQTNHEYKLYGKYDCGQTQHRMPCGTTNDILNENHKIFVTWIVGWLQPKYQAKLEQTMPEPIIFAFYKKQCLPENNVASSLDHSSPSNLHSSRNPSRQQSASNPVTLHSSSAPSNIITILKFYLNIDT